MFRRPAALAIAAAAVLALAATAPAQISKVVPVSATTAEGDSASYHPLFFDAGRAQQVWAASAVAKNAAILNSINFRRDGNNRNYAALSVSSLVVTIGHTSVSPTTMSSTYTANITSTMTTIFSGKYSIGAQPAPTTPPAPFNYKYPMTTPFIYTVAKGNLLMDWITGSGQATVKGGPQWDAVTAAGGTGAVRQFGTWGKFAGNDAANWKADATKLIPGGSADITLAGFSQGYTSRLFVGVSDKSWNGLTLPYDLGAIGAPGNNLYTGLDVIAPFTLKQTSTSVWTANPIFPIPNDNKLIGIQAFVQSYYADAKANAAGLATSNGMELTIGNPGPVSKVIGKDGTTSTTGQNMPITVVQFVGGIN